jgi:hypothetical protein
LAPASCTGPEEGRRALLVVREPEVRAGGVPEDRDARPALGDHFRTLALVDDAPRGLFWYADPFTSVIRVEDS